MTINSFTTLSLDPPLVAWSIGARSADLPVFARACFGISLLSSAQEALARRFADPLLRRRRGHCARARSERRRRTAGARCGRLATVHGGSHGATGRPLLIVGASSISRPRPARRWPTTAAATHASMASGRGSRPDLRHESIAMDMTALQRMLDSGRDNALLRFSLGKGLLEAGDPAGATSHLLHCVAQDPGYSAGWKLLGKAWLAAGDAHAASQAWQQGIDVAQRNGDKQAREGNDGVQTPCGQGRRRARLTPLTAMAVALVGPGIRPAYAPAAPSPADRKHRPAPRR